MPQTYEFNKSDEFFMKWIQTIYSQNLKLNKSAQRFLDKAPEGYLCCDKRKNGMHYRIRENKGGEITSKYLSVTEVNTIRSLAAKPYHKTIFYITTKNIKVIENLLKEYTQNPERVAFETLNENQKHILSDNASNIVPWMHDWMYCRYPTTDFHAEDRKVKTRSGILVRTKAEMTAADSLYNAGIAFRYEPELWIGSSRRYPDFVILHPASTPDHMILIIWEHAGMMDNIEYRGKALEKLNQYCAHDILPGVNMVLTLESKQNVFTNEIAERAIEQLLAMTDGSPIFQKQQSFYILH